MRELTKQIIPTEEIPKSRNNSAVQVTQPPTKTPKVILSKEAVQPAHNKASKVTPNKEVPPIKTNKNQLSSNSAQVTQPPEKKKKKRKTNKTGFPVQKKKRKLKLNEDEPLKKPSKSTNAKNNKKKRPKKQIQPVRVSARIITLEEEAKKTISDSDSRPSSRLSVGDKRPESPMVVVPTSSKRPKSPIVLDPVRSGKYGFWNIN